MNAIETTQLTKRYPDAVAVDDLTLQVETGEVFGFVGPNGAGKSTTIALLRDVRRPTAGTATILGHPVRRDHVHLRRRVGVLPERAGLFARLTGIEHLQIAIRAHEGAGTPSALLARVGLSDDGNRRVTTYSTGMAQRLRLAIALVGSPDLLLLDEPAAGLDPAGIRLLRDVITAENDHGTTVFFSSHNLSHVAAVCDRVGFLVDGRLREVLETDGTREALADRFDELVEEAR